jgi:hypothetical protein
VTTTGLAARAVVRRLKIEELEVQRLRVHELQIDQQRTAA